MAKVKVEYEVVKESHELAMGMIGFVAAIKKSLADGWQLGQDMPALVTAAMTNLVPAVDGLQQLPAEMADLESFMRVWANAGLDVYGILKK